MSQPPHKKKPFIILRLFECHQPTEQCRPIDEIIKKKAMKEHGFAPTKYETMHLSQCAQKHPKRHYAMLSSPHHGQSGGGGSPWGLMANHRCNVSN
jgi:hypothetical protein